MTASSGEMSRVLLAVKSALAKQDAVPLLVFDEIDANVGGNIAVPIDMGGLLMGTLGIGKLEPYEFTAEETKDLQAIASQIAEHWIG